MKTNSKRFERVYNYFDPGSQKRMRLAYINRFLKSEQTFYNKKSERANSMNSFFHEREIEFLENWAKENGMPDDYQPEGYIGQIPVQTE